MGKYLKWYRNYWLGSMTEGLADILIDLKNMKSVPALKHCISNLTKQQISAITSHYEEGLKKKNSIAHLEKPRLSEIQKGTLEDYQTIGAAYMFYAKGVLIGDEVGLGKTVQTAGFYNLLKADKERKGRKARIAFITENSAVSEIRDKLVQFTSDFFYLLPSATKPKLEKLYKYDESFNSVSIVAPHSALGSQQFVAYLLQGGFDAVVVDEGSILRKTTNEMYKNTEQIFKNVEYRIILNATPIEIHLRDMYNQLNIIDKNFLPYYTDFESEYVKKRRKGYVYETVGYKNEKKFFTLIQLRYLARSRVELGAEFTNNSYKVMVVPLSPEQKKILDKTMLKNQLCDCPTSVYTYIPFNEETTPKLKALKHLVREESIAGRRCLIYCRFREAQAHLAEELEIMGYKVECINSDVKNRSEVTGRLDRGEIDIVISTVFRSLDVGKTSTVILYSLESNPQVMRQFEGRITRDFNVEDKNLFMIVSEGYELTTLESKIRMRVMASKSMSVMGASMLYSAILDRDSRENWEEVTVQEELDI